MYKLVTNRIRCKFCGDVIQSDSRHHFVQCHCGSCAVDGGLDYARRVFKTEKPEDTYEDLSIYRDEETGHLVNAKDMDKKDIPTEEPIKGMKSPVAPPVDDLPDIPEGVIEAVKAEPLTEEKVTERDETGKPIAGRYPYGKKSNRSTQ